MVVNILAFLNFCGDGTTTFSTGQKSGKGKFMLIDFFRSIMAVEGFLYIFKNSFTDYRLVFAFIDFVIPLKIPIVDRISKYLIYGAFVQFITFFAP